MNKYSYISQFIKDTLEKKSDQEISEDKNTKIESRQTARKQSYVIETRVVHTDNFHVLLQICVLNLCLSRLHLVK
jgi:hypothetical protein